MNPLDISVLVEHLDRLAASTWHKVHMGPSRGLTFREESLTDHNLFELDQSHRQLTVYKFDSQEEPLNGADFDWWIGNDTSGWLGLRFQAKKLDDGAYTHLGHMVRGERQYNILIAEASSDGMWPLYCFYNGWDGDWPEGIPNLACPMGVSPGPLNMFPRTVHCTHVAIEHFGCAVTPAQVVQRRHQGLRLGRLALESYLASSVPWSRIFAAPIARTEAAPPTAAAFLTAMEEFLLGFFAAHELSDGGGQRQASLPGWVEAIRRGQRAEVRYAPKPRALLMLEIPAE